MKQKHGKYCPEAFAYPPPRDLSAAQNHLFSESRQIPERIVRYEKREKQIADDLIRDFCGGQTVQNPGFIEKTETIPYNPVHKHIRAGLVLPLQLSASGEHYPIVQSAVSG